MLFYYKATEINFHKIIYYKANIIKFWNIAKILKISENSTKSINFQKFDGNFLRIIKCKYAELIFKILLYIYHILRKYILKN